jgi:hypothetical protein
MAGALALGMLVAVTAGLAWVASKAERVGPATSTRPALRTSGAEEGLPDRPSVSIAQKPPACAFPRYRPTHLPWLRPGEAVPEPEFRRLAGGGGQGFDPSYAILFWSHGNVRYAGGPRLKGNVDLWRSSESSGAFPAHPDVPPLPGGSQGGRLSRAPDSPPGSGDWAIVWRDTSPSQYDDGCSETTLGLSLPNLSSEEVREEVLSIAASLIEEP